MSSDTKPKVYLAVALEDDLMSQISAKCDLHDLGRFTREELLEAIHDAEGVLGSPRVKADTEFFDAAPKLRVLCTTSVGFDAIDVDEATKRGVVVCHTPGVLTGAVANLTLSMILGLALRLFPNEAHVRSGNWSARKPAPPLGTDIQGKTLGVIGYGRIGQEVTQRMQNLGMHTLWYDIFDDPPESAPKSEYKPLNDLLAESDFVTLHTNLSESTHHLIGEAELNQMKPEAFLINTARGGLVDQLALTRALQSGQIAGAALDVFESEPPDPDDPIFRLPNVIGFPHIGSATEETRRAMRELSVENLLIGLEGKVPPAPVNPEVIKA
ncbi:MAG: D-glycerate dehydrogenase [Candidatus Latescibacteria bacterium]|jgi:lactate dehydrogenase-like 2-hydroxyacid dehydrogenase|nr:D-glycerate dehydrogenase [Candidatus Latescibacterota bacterium]